MNIWFIMIVVMVLSFIIQQTLQSKFSKYSRVPSPHGLTGADIARLMLKQNGITDVTGSRLRDSLPITSILRPRLSISARESTEALPSQLAR